MARQETKEEETREVIPYYPELGKLIHSLGFNDSTKVFSFLRQCKVNFEYDRIATGADQIEKNIAVFNLVGQSDESGFGIGFIFVMDIPDTDGCAINVDIIHCFLISKDDLIKYLKLKVFS